MAVSPGSFISGAWFAAATTGRWCTVAAPHGKDPAGCLCTAHHPDARLGTDPATAGPRRCAYAGRQSLPLRPPPVRGPTDLKPGEYLWHPEISPTGPIVLVVSLDEQRAYVYRNGIAIGLTTISSGKAGHETPTGVFTILQKDKDHRSNLYSAPMPYMQRLTWDGIALHGGSLPGHPPRTAACACRRPSRRSCSEKPSVAIPWSWPMPRARR